MSAYEPTEFARELRAHMEEWSAGACRRPPMWSHWTEAIHPDHRDLARKVQVADEVKLHKYAAHLLSSQAFVLNLFLPFREGSPKALSECVSRLVETRLLVEEVRFEWVPPGALLGELEGDRPSEDGFTSCNGRDSRWNRRQDVCGAAQVFFGDPNACYLRRPKGKRRDRRYWEIFTESHGSVRDAFPGADADGPCPFAGNAQQPMRNFAIARALEQEGMVDAAWFVLCAHDGNPDVPGHWEVWKGILPDGAVAAGEAEGYGAWAAWMREYYRLGETQ